MNRPAAIVVVLLSAPASAGAQPELCGPNPSPGMQALTVAQSYEKRVPSPRWLAVTVVERRQEDPITFTTLSSDRDRWVGETFVDRCLIFAIRAPVGGHDTASSTIELTRTDADEPFTLLFVLESPKSICAALQDCAAPPLPDDPDSP